MSDLHPLHTHLTGPPKSCPALIDLDMVRRSEESAMLVIAILIVILMVALAGVFRLLDWLLERNF